MDSAVLALLVDSGLEVRVKVEIEVQVMVHCLVIPHPLLHWVLLLSCYLVGTRKRTGLVRSLLVQMVFFSVVLDSYLQCTLVASWLVSLVLDFPLLVPHLHLPDLVVV
jgi:hypothetical protein